MTKIRALWRQIYDVRPGEYLRTLFMFLYLLCILFAYYILKPVSRSMFLNKFDIDDLPLLIILIAIGGGILAYLYSKVAVKTSLSTAVALSSGLSVACLVVMWWLIGLKLPWMIYVLNIWVSLFSVAMVSQGWLVASNIFTAREAKRLYGLLGMAMVTGAAFGGEFTKRTAVRVGTNNLLLASAVMVVLAYVAFRFAAAQKGVNLAATKAAGEDVDFSLRDVVRDIGHLRHLQVICGIMLLQFVVDVLVDYQFQAMAKQSYKGDQLTVFLGSFYGLYLNLTEFVFQFFLTTLVVRRFGVGGTLQVMPVSVAVCSIATVAASGVLSTSAVRLTEASTRYTLNRTGMELLYMPLPKELRNRIKAFIDVFMDRMSRGIGGLLLVLFARILDFTVKEIALLVIVFCIPWIWLSLRAKREYVATIQNRLAARRLDLESARVTVDEPETIRLLELTARGNNSRQAAYAVSLLGEAAGYDPRPILRDLCASPLPEVRSRVYDLARAAGFAELVQRAAADFQNPEAVKSAVAYVLAVSEDRRQFARWALDDANPAVAEAVLEELAANGGDIARDVVSHEWIGTAAMDTEPRRRAVAALAISVVGDQGTEALYRLLADSDPIVIRAACRAAGVLRNRAYLHLVVPRLGDPRLRAVTIESLAAYGEHICGTLSDILADETVPIKVRRQVPRVLKLIPVQRSVDVLLSALAQQDLSMRAAVLKALNRLRETDPKLNFENTFVTQQILTESRRYFELMAALEPFRGHGQQPPRATDLLARTLEERLNQTLDRLFRLLGLRYPPKEIYSAYLAVSRHKGDEVGAAIEFLDNTLERDIKRLLLPLLDAPEHALARGRELFGVQAQDAESAIRDLIRSRDPWLVACAMAAAADLNLRELAGEIAEAAHEAGDEISEVARSAQAILA